MITFSWGAKEISVLTDTLQVFFFGGTLTNVSLTTGFFEMLWWQWLKLHYVLKSLTFGVQSIALSIEWNEFSDGFSIDADWNLLSVDRPEMASSKNAFSVRSFSCFIDEVQRFKGLAWLNIVGILSGLRLNLHTPSSNSTYKKTQKFVRWFYLGMFSFLKTIRILDK